MNTLFQPQILKIAEIIDETSDIKTFRIALNGAPFQHQPGQFALLTPVFGHGEITISISSPPTRNASLDFSIKRIGRVTEIMHQMEVGDQIGLRGPYGKPFPMKDLEGQNLIFIGGGIGIAPLRSVINMVFDDRQKYKDIFILYGARTPQDIVYKAELFEVWPKNKNTAVAYTVDVADKEWRHKVGVVPILMEDLTLPKSDTKVLTCGPPIMIKFVLEKLKKLGYSSDDIITTLEMKMKCGLGKCGRCNIGSLYVCQDGPVFTLTQLEALPKEY